LQIALPWKPVARLAQGMFEEPPAIFFLEIIEQSHHIQMPTFSRHCWATIFASNSGSELSQGDRATAD
jgi:hypothetical protein